MARKVIGGQTQIVTAYGVITDYDSQAKQLIDTNDNFVELYNAVGLGGTAALVVASAPGSGSKTAYAPTGFSSATAGLDIPADDANTTINDLPVGANFQRVRVRNTGLVGTLNLKNANGGSTAAKRFSGADDVGISPGDSVEITYYAGSVNRWIM